MRNARLVAVAAGTAITLVGLGLVLPDGWPYWAYMLAGAPVGFIGARLALRWSGFDRG